MDPTARFFTKLRKLTVTLETETTKLQEDFENRNNDDDDRESSARAMRAYHGLNCDVGNLKGQIQGQLAQQKARGNEVSSFIKACRVMEQRVTQDMQTLRGHWEKYGYQAPPDTQKLTKAQSQESEAEDEDANEDEATPEGGEEDSQSEAEGYPSTSPPNPGPPPFTDVLRTPQLSDFGLSEMQLKRAMAGAEWCSEVPPMPEMSLPHLALGTPALPPMPLTPKCALRMDDDELQTPQMHDFGISEHTMCLNNDFTMDLFKKNVTKPQRPSADMPAHPGDSFMKSFQTQVNKFESPEPPVFCTPGLKIKKANGTCATPAQGNRDQESPIHPNILPTTPEVPAFQTPYMNHIVSTKKSARQTEPIKMQTDDDNPSFELLTSPQNGTTGSKRTWEYNVPEMSIMEMPDLESLLGNTLQSRSAKMLKKTSERNEVIKEPTVKSLELDGPTQEFNLGTPRIRMDYQEPCTPEMPDLSSVTQDICKLLSEAQKKKTVMAIVNPNVRPDKNSPLRRAAKISAVSESEFQSLPSYLRQMTLNNLNQAVHNINKYSEEYQGENTEFQMEELRRITNVGTRTPVYILCLTELKRLSHVGGARNTSVYKLRTHN
uniref:Spindle and kinetochore associated complex subunit 3 n=1 Tax=Labrus bergylta TaxID=56723 RepID=A0A3Q3FGJ2_9LABR|nr:spindle and kinetochore-associated protein 3 [Labrus bergylta]